MEESCGAEWMNLERDRFHWGSCGNDTEPVDFLYRKSGICFWKPDSGGRASKAWVIGSSLAEIAGSNPARSMDVCLLWLLCVVS